MPRRGDARQSTGDCFVLTVLSSIFLDVLLMTGGTEQNPGPLWKWRTPYDFSVLGAKGI
jgi:hypothetical protein